MSLLITTAFLLFSLFILGAVLFFKSNYGIYTIIYAQLQNNMSSSSLLGVNITSPQKVNKFQLEACVMTTKDLNPICSTGQNSPASRPEFIDISLNAASATDTQQEAMEEGDAIENDNENEDDGGEEEDISSDVLPTN